MSIYGSRSLRRALSLSLLMVVALGAAPSVWASSGHTLLGSGDPCGFSSVQGNANLLFSVCTAKSNYNIGDTVLINLNMTNTGPKDVSVFVLQTLDVFSPTKTKFFVAFSGFSVTCGSINPCVIAPGQTLSTTFAWTTPNKGPGPFPEGNYTAQGQLFPCQRISPTEVTCGGSSIALAEITVTLTK